jgi:hypothetical protein
MQEINLRLAVEDVNVILEGVGNLPFAKVYALVGKIQEQAAQQIRAGQAAVKTETGSGAAVADGAGR